MQRRVTLDARLDDVEIGDFVGVEYLCDVAEGGLRVAVRDAAPLARRRDAHADPLGAPNRDEGLGRFPQETDPILDRTAIGLRPLVGAVLDELVDKIIRWRRATRWTTPDPGRSTHQAL